MPTFSFIADVTLLLLVSMLGLVSVLIVLCKN